MKKELIIKLGVLFYMSSILGYFYELFLNYLYNKKVFSHGFFKGPWLPIYGIGSLVIMLLNKYKEHPLVIFWLSFLLSGVVEYSGGYLLLHLFKMRLWDYTGYIGNINGFICLLSLFCFGCGGVLVIYCLYPLIQKLSQRINEKIMGLFVAIVSLLFSLDILWVVERKGI